TQQFIRSFRCVLLLPIRHEALRYKNPSRTQCHYRTSLPFSIRIAGNFLMSRIVSMSKFWSPIVHRLTPYVPGEQPKLSNLVKLNTNENPYPPSPKVLEAIRQETHGGLKLYPDPNADRLKEAIARYYDVAPGCVFVGNGSDEVLAHAFCGLLKQDLPLLFPDITYSFYPVYCGLYEVAYRTVPLTDEFRIAVEDYAQPNGGIIFPNPNAPTGRLLELDQV